MPSTTGGSSSSSTMPTSSNLLLSDLANDVLKKRRREMLRARRSAFDDGDFDLEEENENQNQNESTLAPFQLSDKIIGNAALSAAHNALCIVDQCRESRISMRSLAEASFQTFLTLPNLHPAWSTEISGELKRFFCVFREAVLTRQCEMMGECGYLDMCTTLEVDKTGTHLRQEVEKLKMKTLQVEPGKKELKVVPTKSWAMSRGVQWMSVAAGCMWNSNKKKDTEPSPHSLTQSLPPMMDSWVPIPVNNFDVSDMVSSLTGVKTKLAKSTMVGAICIGKAVDSLLQVYLKNLPTQPFPTPFVLAITTDWSADQQLLWSLFFQKYKSLPFLTYVVCRCAAHILNNLSTATAVWMVAFKPSLMLFSEKGIIEDWMKWIWQQMALVRHSHQHITKKIATWTPEFVTESENDDSHSQMWADWILLVTRMRGGERTEDGRNGTAALLTVLFAADPIRVRLTESERQYED